MPSHAFRSGRAVRRRAGPSRRTVAARPVAAARARPRRRRRAPRRTTAGTARRRRPGRRSRAPRAAPTRRSRAASSTGASIRLVSHAMSYSSCIVCAAKYSATAVSIAAQLLVGRGVRVERRSSPRLRAARRSPTSFVSSLEARDARLAAAQPERHEAVDASARSRGCGRCWRRAGVPRSPVCGKRAGAPCWRRARPPASRRRRAAARPLHERGQRRERGFAARCARTPVGSVQRTGARSGSPVQYMFPLAAITPRSDARHAGARPVEAERRDAAPTPRPARAPGRAGACPARPGCRSRRRRRRAARRARDRRPRARRTCLPAFHARRRCRCSDVARRRHDADDRRRRGRRARGRAARAGSPPRSTTRSPSSSRCGHRGECLRVLN